ncbi:MAG: hypothetical protein ACLU4N_02055 [Butyricimonas faecihominis]
MQKVKRSLYPQETYTAQRKYTLNVVYYVPADMMEFDDWHYRLSGITLHMQNYFYENINRYMHLRERLPISLNLGWR